MIVRLRSESVKKRSVQGFGRRLAELRKGAGLTQEDLGKAVGVSNRVIAYYEGEGAQPPGAMLPGLAQALGVSVDALLGVKPAKRAGKAPPPRRGRKSKLDEQLQAVRQLPRSDQAFVSKFLDQVLAGKK